MNEILTGTQGEKFTTDQKRVLRGSVLKYRAMKLFKKSKCCMVICTSPRYSFNLLITCLLSLIFPVPRHPELVLILGIDFCHSQIFHFQEHRVH